MLSSKESCRVCVNITVKEVQKKRILLSRLGFNGTFSTNRHFAIRNSVRLPNLENKNITEKQ